MARTFALLLGIVFLLIGILGFVMVPHAGLLLGIFAVNKPHNLIHVLIGVLGIVAAYSRRSRVYCIGVGIIYLLVGVLGLVPDMVDSQGLLLHRVHLNMADNILHVSVGGAALLIGLASSSEPANK